MIKIIIVISLFSLIYGLGLDYPPHPYFDEINVVPEARAISQLSHYHGSSHPILGKAIIGLSMRIFGDNPIAWRLPSLIFAAGATALSAYLAFILTGNETLFWLVSFLLATDGLWITQARIGLYNSITMFFILAALICWWKGHKDEQKRIFSWIAAVICFALAVAVKWRAAPAVLFPFIFYRCFPLEKRPSFFDFRAWIYGLFIFMIVYGGTFLIVPFIKGMHWSDILGLQSQIVSHLAHGPMHRINKYTSPWYSWPFLIRPIWFYFFRYPHNGIPLPFQTVEGILCIGNPVIFIIIVPAVIWLTVNAWAKKNGLAVIILTGIILFWVPSGILRFTYFYQFYFTLPFVMIAIAAFLDHLWRSGNRDLRALTAGLLILISTSYVFFLPLWICLPVNDFFFSQHMWLPSWI